MTAQLPPGVTPQKEGSGYHQGVPFAAGRQVIIDPSNKTYLAHSEAVRRCRATMDDNGCFTGNENLYPTPDDLFHAAREYFAWCEANPWMERQTKFSGTSCKFYSTDHAKARPWTYQGLKFYLGICNQTWENYKARPGYSEVCAKIDAAMYEQKITGAANGTFNAVIISRLMGLADKQEVSGPGGGPIEKVTTDMTPEEAMEAYQKTREG